MITTFAVPSSEHEANSEPVGSHLIALTSAYNGRTIKIPGKKGISQKSRKADWEACLDAFDTILEWTAKALTLCPEKALNG